MVINKTSISKTGAGGGRARRSDHIVLHAPLDPAPEPPEEQEEVEDVIDLGAPRLPRARVSVAPAPHARTRYTYTPNPRLYPGPQARAGARAKRRRLLAAHPPRPAPTPQRAPPPRPRRRRARHLPPRALPNTRLYRPPPPRPQPPPLVPRAAWPPPAPPRTLDTASRVALSVVARRSEPAPTPTPTRRSTKQQRQSSAPPAPPPAAPRAAAVVRSRRLVVTLPAAAAGDASPSPASPSVPRYRPVSEHFKFRSLDTDSGASTPRPARELAAMTAPPRHSASPEDRSDGNDPLSAPSEYLAEFLSAIMQRQYAEALKYCRLILQYEPHNATARGFYPLLRHKLGLQRARALRPAPCAASDSDDTSRHSAAPPPRDEQEQEQEEVMSHSADESGSEGSCASQSSLSLDSTSERSGTDRTPASHSHSASAGSSSDARWPSDAAVDADEPDDNGNAPAVTRGSACALRPEDVENDNAGGDHTARLKSESTASLRRLRAQFACEIK